MATQTHPTIQDHLGENGTRWILISTVLAGFVSLLVASANLFLSMESAVQAQIQAAAEAFRSEILTGEYKLTEIKIRELFQLPSTATVKVLDQELNELFKERNYDNKWSKELRSAGVVWNSAFKVSAVAPIFFDAHEKEMFGYLGIQLPARFNWYLFFTLFITLIGSQAFFLYLYRTGVRRIGFELSSQLKNLESEIIGGINQSGSMDIKEFAIIKNSFREIRSQINSLQSNGKLRQVAHDIRSPMSAISLALGTIRDLPPQTRDLFEHSLRRMENIASDLLKEREASGEINLETVIMACQQLIQEKQIEHADRHLLWKMDAENLEARKLQLPFSSLMRTLSNLLNNAAEATPDGSAVCLRISLRQDQLCFSVIDHGPGLSTEAFARAIEGNYSTKPNGHGLGLTSAKKLAVKLNGGLTCQKTDEGFEVQLSLAV